MADHIDSPYEIGALPDPKGYWIIGKSSWGHTQFVMYSKPSRLHRFMTKLLLGWDWQNND